MIEKMKEIVLLWVSMVNFKGCHERRIDFQKMNYIDGQNATGKTTVVDAILWLLFGKDSQGNTSFGIRPVDESGKEIDDIEISVEACLMVDGQQTTFKKIQKQKWTKHRGSTAPTFEGNVNSYEIDGFPQSEKEFKARIAAVILEEDFRLIADLNYFVNLKWQDKKAILLRILGDVTDEDVLNADKEYWIPVTEDILTAGAEKAKEKAKKDLRELNKKQKELPVRIDELSRQVVMEADTDEQKSRVCDLEAKILNLTEEKNVLVADSTLELLKKEKAGIEANIMTLKNALRQELMAEARDVKDELRKVDTQLRVYQETASDENTGIGILEQKISMLKEKLAEYGEQYKAAKEMEFDSKSEFCTLCGQKLPKSKIDSIKKDFEDWKAKVMKDVKDMGWQVRDELTKAEDALERVKRCAEKANAIATEYRNNQYAKAKAKFDALPEDIDYRNNKEYKIFAEQLQKVEEKISNAGDTERKVSELETEIAHAESEKKALNKIIWDEDNIKARNVQINDRINDLKNEQRDIGQKIAYTEQKLILLEEFSIKKSELLSKKISESFRLTTFSLFNQQINGGLVEECEIQYRGVKYKDLNSGHRIAMALDIIRTFQERLGIMAPVMVDNAETINTENIPEMPCQMILLRVTNDPELKVTYG